MQYVFICWVWKWILSKGISPKKVSGRVSKEVAEIGDSKLGSCHFSLSTSCGQGSNHNYKEHWLTGGNRNLLSNVESHQHHQWFYFIKISWRIERGLQKVNPWFLKMKDKAEFLALRLHYLCYNNKSFYF